MHASVAFLLAAAAVCAIARPFGPTPEAPEQNGIPEDTDNILPESWLQRYLDFFNEAAPLNAPENDWIDKEIERMNNMNDDDEESTIMVNDKMTRWISDDPKIQNVLGGSLSTRDMIEYEAPIDRMEVLKMLVSSQALGPVGAQDETKKTSEEKDDTDKEFALTPDEDEFYAPEYDTISPIEKTGISGHHEGAPPNAAMIPLRRIRQNPNLSKNKNLVAEDLDLMRTVISHEEGISTDKPPVHVKKAAETSSFYIAGVLAAAGAAMTMIVIGFAFGWYTLTQKAKAAADVDYPAYGVTGPTVDVSGDRKLAHSAHMYHYQHQKQQIIAMERTGIEQHSGSISDPESDDDNEEGDYTVYECPGFATTGNLEVKNPMYTEDPTPSTSAKCHFVQPQPKQ